MFFHTQEEGIFFMNLGQISKIYPFTKHFGGIQSRIENKLQKAKKVLKSVDVNNVFFNIGENDNES